MNWVGGTLYPGVKCPREQDIVPTVSCPRGQDKPGGGGTFYPRVKCPRGQDTTWYLVPEDKIPRGQDKPVHRYCKKKHCAIVVPSYSFWVKTLKWTIL